MSNVADREQITDILGELDDLVIADIQNLGVSAEEVRKAREWLYSGSIERREGHPNVRVGKVVQLLQDDVDADAETVDM